MGDVVDLRGRLKKEDKNSKNAKNSPPPQMKNTPEQPVLDMTERREKMIQAERRIAKRTILSGFIGAHVIIPGKGLVKVSVYDISKGGLSFDIPEEAGHFKDKEELAMRFYFNQTSYFPFEVKVMSCRLNEEEGVYRHGANFAKDSINNVALNHFVDFLENVSAALKTDKGDILVSGLGY